jgi:hypothetical protein
MPVEKPTTNPTTTQSTKPKEKVEAGSSTKTNNPVDNTRKAAAQESAIGKQRSAQKTKEDNNSDQDRQPVGCQKGGHITGW